MLPNVLGLSFFIDEGKQDTIICLLYSSMSANLAFHAHLGGFMWKLGYRAWHTNHDLWLKDGTHNYVY